MRTKTLLMTAALAAAGVATSMAQVYSVNAVGYVNTTLQPGFNLISNPLEAANNSIDALFRNFQGGTPDGMIVYRFDNASGNFQSTQYDGLDNIFSPADVAALTTLPGDGVFVLIPRTLPAQTLTFVGQVPQGQTTTTIPTGFSIKSSVVPQAADLSQAQFNFPAGDGDILYRYSPATGNYTSYQFDGLDNIWSPALPTLNVGEAFFYLRNRANGQVTWTRNFSVNN